MMETIHTDVVVLGGGAAGARAAIEAAKGARVAVLSKGIVGSSGITPLAFTGYSAFTGGDPADSPETHIADITAGGRYLSDPRLVETMARAGRETVQDLIRFGVRFAKDGENLLLQLMPGNSFPRCLKIVGAGPGFMQALARTVGSTPGVTLFPDAYATNIFLADGCAVGVGVLDARTGEFRLFTAGALVLATGGCEQLWPRTDCPPESTGDGYAMALRAGAELVDMEQQLFYPTIAVHPAPVRGLEISYERCLRPGGGGQLVNGLGQPFFQAETFPTRDQLSNLIYQEIAAGRAAPHGGVYLDLLGAQDWLKEELPRTLACFSRLVHFGIDIREQRLEVAPGAHTSLGGVRIDEKAATTVPGLFACGEVAGNVHGANRLAGHALLDTQVFGIAAGRSAAEYAGKNRREEPGPVLVREEQARVLSLRSGARGSARPFEIARWLRGIMDSHVTSGRTAAGLQAALQEIRAMRTTELPHMQVAGPERFNNDWLEALELSNMLDAAEVVVRSALARDETRGTHTRSDCPWTRDEPQHVVIRSTQDGLTVCQQPVRPLGREG